MAYDDAYGDEPVVYGRDSKFDLQLSASLVRNKHLGQIFTDRQIDRLPRVWLEEKSEQHQWERTQNICIEWADNGRPSGIMTTESDYWVHELLRDGRPLCFLMFPIDRLRELERHYRKLGKISTRAGDDKRMSVTLIPLREILR